MVRKNKFIFKAVAVLMMFSQTSAHAAGTANATGTATATVLASIGIATVSALAFPPATPGDAAFTVPPGAAENAQNASFNVTGAPNTAYTITLPAAPINMVNGANTISVGTFVSTPAAGVGTGMLSAGGAQTIFVGATRAALGAAQATGNYSGTFTVTVNY